MMRSSWPLGGGLSLLWHPGCGMSSPERFAWCLLCTLFVTSSSIKKVIMQPLLKKATLEDPVIFDNYCPVMNTPILGKVLEMVMMRQQQALLVNSRMNFIQRGTRELFLIVDGCLHPHVPQRECEHNADRRNEVCCYRSLLHSLQLICANVQNFPALPGDAGD